MNTRFVKTSCLCLGLLSILVLCSCGGNTTANTSGTADVTASKTTLAADAALGSTQQTSDALTTTDAKITKVDESDVLTTTDKEITKADEKEDSKNLNTPDGITVYDHGTSRSPTSDTVSELIKAVNKHLNDDTLYYTKLYVSADTVNEIQNNQSCVELRYDTEQILETSKMSGAPDEFSFSKILLCLSGEHSANIFFYNDNAYQSGTVKISGGSFCDEILGIVQ